MDPSKTLLATLIGLLLATSALAAPPSGRGATRAPSSNPPIRATVPTLSCSIVPAAIPGPNEFQATQATVTLASGVAGTNKVIEIRLGSRPTGTLLGTICTSDLGRTGATTTVTIGPPITDPNYTWLCNAKQTSTTCTSSVPH